MGTTTTAISRMKVVHPDLGYDGGADLHTYIRTIYNQFGDNINSRVFLLSAFANGATAVLEHNLGTSMSHNRYMLYSGSYLSMFPLTSVTTPSIDQFTIISTVGFEDSKMSITNNSGGLRDIVVVLYQDSISPNPLTAKIQTTPPAAPTGYFAIYPKADGKIYRKGSDGIETIVGGGLTPQKVTIFDSPVQVKDGTNYLVDTTGGIVSLEVTAGSSALLQFGLKNDGSTFSTNNARVKCNGANIYIPDLGTVVSGDYFIIDVQVDAILFDWDGTRWVASISGLKDFSTYIQRKVTNSTGFSAQIRDCWHVDTSGGVKTVNLPASPVAGDWVEIADAKNTFATNACTIGRSGKNINGLASDFSCDVSNKIYTAVFIDEAYGWAIYF